MADKRTVSRTKRNQRDDDKRGGGETSSSSSKRGLQGGAAALEVHEYQCSGDFLEDYKQSVKSVGIPPEEAPKIIAKANYSLWRGIELPAPPLPVSDEPRLSQSPPPDIGKFAKSTASGGKSEPHPKTSLMDSNSKGKGVFEKDKGASKDKNRKKGSKITNGKTEQSSPKSVEQKISPSTENIPRGVSALDTPGKKLERLFTSKGREKDSAKGKDNDLTSVQDSSAPPVEGTDAKPLQVVYEPFAQNRIKEAAIRGWIVDRQVLEVLQKCFVVAEKLTTLILADCGLKGSDMVLLSDVIPKIPNLEFLALDGNFISEQNHGLVLSKSSTLRSLTIRFANLDDKALQNLSLSWSTAGREWSSERPGLEYLDLSRNKITDGGLEYLAQVLRFNRSLTTLSLAGNRLSDKSVGMLCSCVFTRFILTRDELLERRTKKALFTPPIINPAIYALKRKYQQAVDAEAKAEGKTRSEKDDRKRDKDDKKAAAGSRMSGARISAGGNAVKPSPPAGSRGTGSAHPERIKPGTPQKKVEKSGSKNIQPSANSSQPQVHVDDGETALKAEQSKEVPSRLKAVHDTHAHHKDHVDEGESIASASHNDLADPVSALDLEGSEEVMAGGHAAHAVPSLSSQDGLYAAPTASLDSRLAALLNDLRKHNHSEMALADYDIWLDHSKKLWKVTTDNPEVDSKQLRAEKQAQQGFYGSSGKTPADYQAVLLKYCQGIVNGTATMSALPTKIQQHLLRFVQDPYFMFAGRREEAAQAHTFLPQQSPQPDNGTTSPQQKSPVKPTDNPKFRLEVIEASVTNLQDSKNKHSTVAVSDGKAEPEVGSTASTADLTRSPEATGKLPVGDRSRLSTGVSRNTPRIASSAIPGHRKLSVKKVKGRKGEVESSAEVPAKECPYYNVIAVEEKFDALLDGMIVTEGDRVICDGNRTLKVLNLMSNRVTSKSIFALMETVNRQREEQAAALMWENPVPPEVVLPRPPPAPAVSVTDMFESESNIAKKDNKPDERSAAKKSAVPVPRSRTAAADIDSVTSSTGEDGSGDECSPIVVQTRVVRNPEDPNRQNAGLLFVELEHNSGLEGEDAVLELFDTFMHQQRESLGVTGKACTEELHDKRTLWRHSIKPTDEVDLVELDLKELPLADPARYSLLKSQYLLEKKKDSSVSNSTEP